MANQRWVFVVRALDQPGTLTATASVFSNRGVSLESILASGIAPTTVEEGRLILIFQATEARQTLLHRALERLPAVLHVDAYTYDDERLRAVAVAKLSLDAAIARDHHYSIETIAETDHEQVVMLTGTPPAIDQVVGRLRQQAQLKDIVMSYLTV